MSRPTSLQNFGKHMRTHFHTNIDCCKSFLPRLNEELSDAQPSVGDKVVIYEDSRKIIELQVVDRTWKTSRLYSSHGETALIVDLHLTSFWQEQGIPAFEAFVKGH